MPLLVFSSEVSFWRAGKREGQLFQSVGGSLSTLISQESAVEAEVEVYIGTLGDIKL